MNALPSFEKAEAYLTIHLTHDGPPAVPDPAAAFVTISRESGCGGTAFASALAQRIGALDPARPWQVYSGNLIEEMLLSNNLSPQLARFLPEDRISEINASVGEIVGLHPNLWCLVRKTNELMRQLARAGHAILLGRGAAFATAGIAHGVHVRLIGDSVWRAAETARRLSLECERARAYNAARDAARARYVRATFGADIAEPGAYDLVLNTAQVPRDLAVELVVRLVQARQPARA